MMGYKREKPPPMILKLPEFCGIIVKEWINVFVPQNVEEMIDYPVYELFSHSCKPMPVVEFYEFDPDQPIKINDIYTKVHLYRQMFARGGLRWWFFWCKCKCGSYLWQIRNAPDVPMTYVSIHDAKKLSKLLIDENYKFTDPTDFKL